MVSLRSSQKLPPCPAEPTPASSETDLLANAKPVGDVSKASGIAYLRRKKLLPRNNCSQRRAGWDYVKWIAPQTPWSVQKERGRCSPFVLLPIILLWLWLVIISSFPKSGLAVTVTGGGSLPCPLSGPMSFLLYFLFLGQLRKGLTLVYTCPVKVKPPRLLSIQVNLHLWIISSNNTEK